jgi:hypothetical protein
MSKASECKHEVNALNCKPCFQEINDSFMANSLETAKNNYEFLQEVMEKLESEVYSDQYHIHSPEFLRIT